MKKLFICFLLCGCAAAIPDEPTARIEFTAPDFYPEGIAYDSIANVYYVSSARTGEIGKVTSEGSYKTLIADNSFKSGYGMKVHPDGKRLYVCVADANYSKFTSPETRKKMGRLVVIDIASGKKISDIDLAALIPGKHFPNDLTFDRSGNAYITDSFANVIYKVSADGTPSVFCDSPMFKTEGIGLNGIVWNPSGFLLTVSSATGIIYKVDIENPKNVTKVQSEQYFMNGDGLILKDSKNLIVVQNGGTDKVYQMKSDDNWASTKLAATTFAADRFTYPSTAAKNGDKIWVMNAKFSEIVDSTSVPSQKFAIQHARFMPIPKKFQ